MTLEFQVDHLTSTMTTNTNIIKGIFMHYSNLKDIFIYFITPKLVDMQVFWFDHVLERLFMLDNVDFV
jgi:hypothetical protein